MKVFLDRVDDDDVKYRMGDYDASMMYAKKMLNMDDDTLESIMPDCLIS